MTICANCTHFHQLPDGARCMAPAVRQPERTNYVTGDRYRPVVWCSDVNKDGKCPHFELATIDAPLAF